MRRTIILAFIIIMFGTLVFTLWRSNQTAGTSQAPSMVPLLAETGSAGFTRATEPGALDFPQDLGPHNDYQTEWWYYTGNLETLDGRQFGFQLTFFRRAIKPPSEEEDGCPDYSLAEIGDAARLICPDESTWRTNQLYLAHFTISDISSRDFYPFERFSRGAAGLAGAQASPYHVWLEDWQALEEAGGIRLKARSGNVSLNLLLTETLAPIRHGDGGLSVKGPEPGNASYYYSLVQQMAEGVVGVGDELFEVDGLVWKDHEYSTSALSDGAVGWDWFSIQLDDGSALMFFQIRNRDGSIEPASSGTYIFPDGSTRSLGHDEWWIDVLDSWTSPTTGFTYPAGWQIEIPVLNLTLTGQPLMANQELNVSTIYWEGATGFEGRVNGQPVTGKGYVELTGYGEETSGRR